MARQRAAYYKLRKQANERTYQGKIESIMAPPMGYGRRVLTDAEREAMTAKRRLVLKVRTTTDVGWCTISTCDAGKDAQSEDRQRAKLRSLWINGFRAMYPDGTEWTIKNEYW